MTYLPHFPYSPKDFRADTRHLSAVERDAYRELLDEMWITDQSTCSIPDDDRYIAGVLRTTVKAWRKIRGVLVVGVRPVLHLDENGRITQFRLREEMKIAQSKSQKAKENVNVRISKMATVKAGIAESRRQHGGRTTDHRPIIDRSSDVDLNQKPETRVTTPTESADEPPRLTSSQQAVAEIESHCRESAMGELPSPGRIAKWLKTYGADLVRDVFANEGVDGTLAGQTADYLQGILKSRKLNPRRRIKHDSQQSQLVPVAPEPSPDEARESRRALYLEVGPLVGDWIEKHGIPENGNREKFRGTMGLRWDQWLKLEQEFGEVNE